MHRPRTALCLVAMLALGAIATAQPTADWPRFRGAALDGAAPHAPLPERFGLEVLWKKSIGEGYSAISVAGDLGITMCSAGDDDVVLAFDAATGSERWRYRIGAVYKAHSGSDGGPVSTPAIHDGVVYGFGRHGEIFAVRLADGSEVWSRKLDGKTDSFTPRYGFSSSPLVVGDVVVLATGGPKGHSISAYDRRTGEPRWRVGDDKVAYQSPGVIELGGKPLVLAINDRMLYGIDPTDGRVRCEFAHTKRPRDGIALPHVLDDNRVLITSLGDAQMLSFSIRGGKPAVKRLWQSRAFRGSYALPVHHDGYLYGYNSRFLTCVDAKTGKRRWRSRPPGGEGLILVGDQLALLSPEGDLVLADASPDGFKERARTPVLDKSNFTAPVFAGGRFFVRNKGRIAAARITTSADALAAARSTKTRELLGAFGEWVARVEASDDKLAEVYRYFANNRTSPIVEPDGTTHFIYRGKVEDIALTGSFLPFRDEVPLDRVAGTDVYFKSVRLDPAGCYEYRFTVDFGRPTIDPANPREGRTMLGPMSILRMPKFRAPSLDPVDEARAGRVDSFQFRSAALGAERRVRIYVPAAYTAAAAAKQRFPLVLVLHGDDAVEHGGMKEILDERIHAGRVAPLLAVFIQGGRRDFGNDASKYLAMLGDELLPHVEKHYRVSAERTDRAVIGSMDGATMGLYATVERPGRFGKVGVQSPYLNAVIADPMFAKLKAHPEAVDLYIEVRATDFLLGDTIDARRDAERLIDATSGTRLRVTRRDRAGSWGWSDWQAGWGAMFEHFFPGKRP